MDTDFTKRWVEELQRMKEQVKRGIIIGVEISKPKPWPPAVIMIRLHEEGADLKTIARKTGYSVPTVERNLRLRGEDPRTGAQCERFPGRIFSIDEALSEMPLPCSTTCICSWRPLLRSDFEPA